MSHHLKHTIETDHFILRYGWRCSRSGRGIGDHGIKDRNLILRYIEALELGYERITSPLFDWQLNFGSNYKTEVLIYDIMGLLGCHGITSYNEGKPLIRLASRNNEPSMFAEFLRASASAVHEVTHVFNFVHHPPQEDDPWLWFEEGTCVFMENFVYPENTDNLRYLLNWCDHPEISLDDPHSNYAAWMFVRFLVKRFGARKLTEIWTNGGAPTPWDALENVFDRATNPRPFSSAIPETLDIFGSGYCVDAYFLSDPKSGCFNPEILARYGERMVTESFVRYPVTEAARYQQSIDHLGCRYYRFYPSDSPEGTLSVWVRPDQVPAGENTTGHQGDCACLKAMLIQVNQNHHRGSIVHLLPQIDGALQGVVPNFSHRNCDHAVLVIANCSWGSRTFDEVGFTIDAQIL